MAFADMSELFRPLRRSVAGFSGRYCHDGPGHINDTDQAHAFVNPGGLSDMRLPWRRSGAVVFSWAW